MSTIYPKSTKQNKILIYKSVMIRVSRYTAEAEIVIIDIWKRMGLSMLMYRVENVIKFSKSWCKIFFFAGWSGNVYEWESALNISGIYTYA